MLKEWIVFYCCIYRKTNQTFSHKKSTLKRQNLKIKTKSHIFMDDQRWYIIVSYSEIIDLTLLVLYTYRRDKSDSDTSLNSGDAMSWSYLIQLPTDWWYAWSADYCVQGLAATRIVDSQRRWNQNMTVDVDVVTCGHCRNVACHYTDTCLQFTVVSATVATFSMSKLYFVECCFEVRMFDCYLSSLSWLTGQQQTGTDHTLALLNLLYACFMQNWVDISNVRRSIQCRFLHFPVLHFPPLQSGAAFSVLAFSASPSAVVHAVTVHRLVVQRIRRKMATERSLLPQPVLAADWC